MPKLNKDFDLPATVFIAKGEEHINSISFKDFALRTLFDVRVAP